MSKIKSLTFINKRIFYIYHIYAYDELNVLYIIYTSYITNTESILYENTKSYLSLYDMIF